MLKGGRIVVGAMTLLITDQIFAQLVAEYIQHRILDNIFVQPKSIIWNPAGMTLNV